MTEISTYVYERKKGQENDEAATPLSRTFQVINNLQDSPGLSVLVMVWDKSRIISLASVLPLLVVPPSNAFWNTGSVCCVTVVIQPFATGDAVLTKFNIQLVLCKPMFCLQ